MTNARSKEAGSAGRSPAVGHQPAVAVDTRVRRAQDLYQLGHARWYDAFRAIWTGLSARAAEVAFDRLVSETGRTGCQVLDIGCGTGYNLGRLQQLGIPFSIYHGIDPTDAMLAIARERYAEESRATFVETDFRAFAETSQCFDLVLCTWVASHVDRPREIFELAHRLLRPSGHALLLVMSCPHWSLNWWFVPLARLFQAHCVGGAALCDLPGAREVRPYTAGLVTLVHLERSLLPQE